MAPRKSPKKATNQRTIDCYFKPMTVLNSRPALRENPVVPVVNLDNDEDVIIEKEILVNPVRTPSLPHPKKGFKRKKTRKSTGGSSTKRTSPLTRTPINFTEDLTSNGKIFSPVCARLVVSSKTSTPLDAVTAAPRRSGRSCKRSLFTVSTEKHVTSYRETSGGDSVNEVASGSSSSSSNNNGKSNNSTINSSSSEDPSGNTAKPLKELNDTMPLCPGIQDEETVDGTDLHKSGHDAPVVESSKSHENPTSHKLQSEVDEKLVTRLDALSPFKPSQNSSDIILDTSVFNSFKVTSIVRNNKAQRITLKLKDENGRQPKCVLSGTWFNTIVGVGDVVNIKTTKFSSKTLEVDSEEGIIVVKPGNLISSTSVTSSLHCSRLAWLNERFYGGGSTNKCMFVGILVHEIFQTACSKRYKTLEELNVLVAETLMSHDTLLSCYATGMSMDELEREINGYMPSIVQWLKKYLHGGPQKLENGTPVEFLKVADVEDNFWSPNLGLKGKIDLSFTANIYENGVPRKAYIPLELKTGRTSFSFQHQGQVLLYTMMIDESNYGPCDSGFLLYLKGQPEMKYVTLKPKEKIALIETRNELAYYYSDREIGPPVRDNEKLCSKCECLLPCSLMFKSFGEEKYDCYQTTSQRLVPSALRHLKEEHLAFFKKWITMINLEDSVDDLEDFDAWKECFWNKSSVKCEAEGLGLSKMAISEISDLTYTLCRQSAHCGTKPVNDVVKPGERVALSVDGVDDPNSRIAFAIGFVTTCNKESLSVRLDKSVQQEYEGKTLRLDKISSRSLYCSHRNNLLSLMVSDRRPKKLRSLLIDREEPVYTKISKRSVAKSKDILLPLSELQQRAVLKIVASANYALIESSSDGERRNTLVAAIRFLHRLGSDVLLTSYTHSALDAVLLQLKTYNVPFLRLGSLSRIHPDLHSHSDYQQTKDMKQAEELANFYDNCRIVATTCLSLNHPLFEKRSFHYCLIEEATHLNISASLGSMLMADVFALFGDSKRDAITVKSGQSRELGFGRSIFEVLHSDKITITLS